MKLKIFTAGGTIDKIYFDKKSLYEVGYPTIFEILKEANVTLKYNHDVIITKDSLELTKKDRKLISDTILNEKAKRILVTHGTDTMIKTTRKLKNKLPDDNKKTIVFTGSMTPARFKRSDAVFNIGGALIAAQTLKPGVYIVMNGKVFDPDTSIKNIEQHCFEKLKK